MSVAEYVRRKSNLTFTTFVVKSTGECFYITEIGEIPREQFERDNALPMSLIAFQKSNVDGTKNWLN